MRKDVISYRDLQQAKQLLMIKATGIGLWEMAGGQEDPSSPDNEFAFSDEFRWLLGFESEADFPNKFQSQVACIHPDDRQHVLDVFRAHVLDHSGQTPYDLEYRMIKKNGEVGYFRDVGETLRDELGNPLHTAGALIDVTEKWRDAQEKEFQLSKMKMILRAAGMCPWDLEMLYDDPANPKMVFRWSPEFRQMLGYEDESDFPDEMDAAVNSVHPEDIDRVLEELFSHLNDKTGQTPFDSEYRMRKKNGEYIYIKDSAETMRDESGNPIHTSGAMQDVTETKRLLLENEQQLGKLNMAIRATKIGLWEMEVVTAPFAPGNLFTYTDEFRQLLGYQDESDFPNTYHSLASRLHPGDSAMVLSAFGSHLRDTSGNTPYDIEYRVIKKNGEIAHYHATADTTRDKNGNPVHTVGAIQDITHVKNLVLEIDKQRQEAETANMAKSTFLSTMSHEIRTPMNAILGITEMQLQKSGLDEESRKHYEKIYASGDMLLRIINDILDLSKIEASRLELLHLPYELASLLSDTFQLNMMRTGSKPIEFELHVDETLPTHLIGDEIRIKQILNNLLSNAIKYTEAGVVKMAVGIDAGEDPEKSVLVLTVSDTGQGMTEEQVEKLFDEYARFNTAANREVEGTGLGTHIAQKLVRLMHGEIFVKSRPGEGSVFTVRLPQALCGAPQMGRELAENLGRFRTCSCTQMKRAQITREPMPYGKILIVDDVETNIYVARGLLAPYQLQIDSASSGPLAIEKIRGGKVYDVVFMDHMMPKMDGIEATRQIREMGYIHPIVALTANAVSGQDKVFLGSGFDAFISKPIDIRQLNTVLNELVRDKHRRKVAGPPAKKPGNAPPPKKSPLITKLLGAFAGDADRALRALKALPPEAAGWGTEEWHTYRVHVHGIKTALVNIGRKDLSATAMRLEGLSREEDIEAITAETPAFLEALRDLISEIVPPENEAGEAISKDEEDRQFLQEKLEVILAACHAYYNIAAEEALRELQTKKWSRATQKLLAFVSDQLLLGGFDEIIDAIQENFAKPL